MLTLKNIEHKFSELRKEELNIKEFEIWVYENETIIKKEYTESVYDDLIILSYNKHAQSELAKILEIDYCKLELYELHKTIETILAGDNINIDEVSHDLYESVYDPHSRVWFGFKINDTGMGISYPFQYDEEFPKLSNAERNELFKEQFKHPDKFLKTVLDQVNSNNFRIVVMDNLANVDNNNYTETICGTKDDILSYIGNQRVLMNKELLKLSMNKYWL